MIEKAEEALKKSREVSALVNDMIERSHDLDMKRLLKQIDADLMDVQHKISLVVRLARKD